MIVFPVWLHRHYRHSSSDPTPPIHSHRGACVILAKSARAEVSWFENLAEAQVVIEA